MRIHLFVYPLTGKGAVVLASFHRVQNPTSFTPDNQARILRLLALGWLALGCGQCLAGAEIVRAHRQELFNGTNLSGWYSWLVDTKREDPRRVFTVTNELLRISGNGLGYLATSNVFRNYRFSLEFKWGTRNWSWGDRPGKARDSGVFLHAIGPDGNSHDGNGAFMAAIECNVFQGATGDFLLIRGTDADGRLIAPRVMVAVAEKRDAEGWPWWQPDGSRTNLERWGRVNWLHKSPHWRDETDFRGDRDVEHPSGEWNRLEITCAGSRIEIVLNGTKVNEAREVWPTAGRILLQCEGSEIFFRNLHLTSLNL